MNERQLQYNALVEQAEAIRAKYLGTTEKWTQEDSVMFDRIMEDADGISEVIEREKRLSGHKTFQRTPEPLPVGVTEPAKAKSDVDKEAVTKAFRSLLRHGQQGVSQSEYATLRAYSAGSDTEGGFLVMPEEFIAEVLQGVDNDVFVRQFGRVIQLPKAESLGVPTLDTDVSDADWTVELATGSLDEAMRLGKRELTPHPLAKRTKMSRKLMRAAVINPEQLVLDRIRYKFAVTQEKGFLTGNGAQQPLGVFTASANGISTGRDVVTGSATDFTADGIINAAYTLKPQYWTKARWLMHREALRNIRKLKDASGNYLWASGISTRTEPTIMDMPFTISEYAPNTFSNGNYAALLGDFSYYWIVEALDMQMQVLTELYAETNQIGYIGRCELDGAPVLEEAFVRLKFSV